MDKEQLMQYLTEVAKFSGASLALMYATAENVLEGKEINMQRWQEIAAAYEDLALMGTALSLDLGDSMPEAEAIGKFAQLLCMPHLDRVYDVIERMPVVPEFALPQLLMKAIIAEQRTRLYPDQSAERMKLAECYSALIPYARTTETTLLGLRRTVETFRDALEHLERENISVDVLRAASLFVGLSNELATKLSVPDYIEQALRLGEDLLEKGPLPFAAVAPYVCTLANNLASTCNWLIRNSAQHQAYYEKGLAFAAHTRKAADASLNAQVGDNSYLAMQEMSISAFVFLHASMAVVTPEQFNTYAYTAYQHLQEYKLLMFEYKDENVTQKYHRLEQSIYELLHAAQPDWQVPDIHMPDSSSFDFTQYSHIEPIAEQAWARVDEIVAQANSSEQHAMVKSTLDSWYAELASWFPPIIAEVGLNHHICRLILALGAVTSGRIGSLVMSQIPSWVFHLEVPDPNSPERIAASQQWLAVYHIKEVSSIIGILWGIVELIEASRDIPSLRDTIIPMLRERNSVLLQNLLPSIRIQRLDSKLQTDNNDLALLFRGFPEAAKKRGLEAYTSTRVG